MVFGVDRRAVVEAIGTTQGLVNEAFAFARVACGYAINLRSETQVKEYLYDIAKFPVRKVASVKGWSQVEGQKQ